MCSIKRSVVLATLLLAVVMASGCGGDSANKSHFLSLIAAAAKNPDNAGASTIRIPLVNTRVTQDGVKLLTEEPAFDYAILQTLVDEGVLKRDQYAEGAIHYTFADQERAKQIFVISDWAPSINWATLQPEKITNFTKPGDEVSNPDSTATVVFEPHYADWLTDARRHLIRQWYGIAYGQRYEGPNPALSDDETTQELMSGPWIDRMQRGSRSDRDLENAFRQLTVANWAMMSLSSVTKNVLLHRSDDGWQIATSAAEWQIQDNTHLPPLKKADLDGAADDVRQTLNPDTPSSAKINKAEIEQALADERRLTVSTMAPFNVSRQMPALGLRPKTCDAEARRGWNQVNVHYDCTEKNAHQLNILAEHGLAARSVPSAGRVEYTPTDKIKPFINGGQLTIGVQKVVKIVGQKSSITWYGQPKIFATVDAKTDRYDWSKNDAFSSFSADKDGEPHHYQLELIKNGDGSWQIGNYAEISR